MIIYLHLFCSCFYFRNQKSETSHNQKRAHMWSSCTMQQVTSEHSRWSLYSDIVNINTFFVCLVTAEILFFFILFLLFVCFLLKTLPPCRMTNRTVSARHSPPTHTNCIRLYICVVWQHRKVCSGVDECFERGCSMVCDKVRQCSGGHRLQLRLWQVAHITNITPPDAVTMSCASPSARTSSLSGYRLRCATSILTCGGANNCAIVLMLFEVTLMEEWLNWGLNYCHFPLIASVVWRCLCLPWWDQKRTALFLPLLNEEWQISELTAVSAVTQLRRNSGTLCSANLLILHFCLFSYLSRDFFVASATCAPLNIVSDGSDWSPDAFTYLLWVSLEMPSRVKLHVRNCTSFSNDVFLLL